MKKPKTDRFDPNQRQQHIEPEDVDFSGVPAIQKQAPPASRPPADSPSEQAPSPQSPTEHQTPASKQESKVTAKQPRERASMLARKHGDRIESIRKVVKDVGKEVAYVRMTPEEKRKLEDVVHAYKQQGIKTSENEILRIALQFLMEDYEADGQDSVLDRVLEALNA